MLPQLGCRTSFAVACLCSGRLARHVAVRVSVSTVCRSLTAVKCRVLSQLLILHGTDLDSPLRLQDVEASRISSQSAHEGGKVVSPTHRPLLPPMNIPGTHFC